MEDSNDSKISTSYIAIVLLLMLVLPLLSVVAEFCISKCQISIISSAGKWFLFWGVGIRLFTAGFRQAINPAFTAKEIFHIEQNESFIVVKELGFANVCLGSIGVISLFCPDFRIPSAFAGGLFMGIAGITHLIKKPVSGNEWVAMFSDNFIFLIMVVYIVNYYI